MPKTIIAAVVALATLAACGGEAVPPPPVPIGPATLTDSLGNQTNWTDAACDPARDEFVLTFAFADGTSGDFVLPRNTAREDQMPDGFRAYGDGGAIAVRGATESGSGSFYAVRSSFDGIEYGLERFGDTILPTTGSVTFNGGYAGVLGDVENDLANLGQVNGTAMMTADFADGEVSGLITDRINSNGRVFDDLILLPASIDPATGSFGNFTDGGVLTGLEYDTANGSYNGLFVGADGAEIVGGVEVIHLDSVSTTIVETGGFVC